MQMAAEKLSELMMSFASDADDGRTGREMTTSAEANEQYYPLPPDTKVRGWPREFEPADECDDAEKCSSKAQRLREMHRKKVN